MFGGFLTTQSGSSFGASAGGFDTGCGFGLFFVCFSNAGNDGVEELISDNLLILY